MVIIKLRSSFLSIKTQIHKKIMPIKPCSGNNTHQFLLIQALQHR